MRIQQVIQVRRQVQGSDGRTRTEVTLEPADAELLAASDGNTYTSEGNGVFHVPDAIGTELVGGLFRDVSDPSGSFTRARIELANQHAAKTPQAPPAQPPAQAPPEAPRAAEEGAPVPNAAAPLPEGLEAPEPAKPKPTRKRAPRKATAKKK